jgi:hypothetical protein
MMTSLGWVFLKGDIMDWLIAMIGFSMVAALVVSAIATKKTKKMRILKEEGV